jgi:hypothetical protein
MPKIQESLYVTFRSCGLAAEARVEVVGDERYSHASFRYVEIEISRLLVAGKKDYTRCPWPTENFNGDRLFSLLDSGLWMELRALFDGNITGLCPERVKGKTWI